MEIDLGHSILQDKSLEKEIGVFTIQFFNNFALYYTFLFVSVFCLLYRIVQLNYRIQLFSRERSNLLHA